MPQLSKAALYPDCNIYKRSQCVDTKMFFCNIRVGFFSIADLSKHKRYEIRLSVYNAVGEGPISTPQEVFVGEAGEHSGEFTGRPVTAKGVKIHLKSVLFLFIVYCRVWYSFLYSLVPTAPPQNVAVQSSTATQLDVTWDPPPLEAQNGDIQGYKVAATFIPAIELYDLASTSFNNIFYFPRELS